MDYKQLAERLFPDVTTTVDDLEARYPARDLAEGAMITRLAQAQRDSSTSAISTVR